MQASKLVTSFGVAALIALAIGCSSNKLSPTLPTDVSTAATSNSDGSMLKVSTPTPTSPANNVTFDTGVDSATLTANAATTQFASSAALTYRFQVLKGNDVVVDETASPSGTTVSASTDTLDAKTTYTWRVRAESNGVAGPWSPSQTFTTGDVPVVQNPQNTADWVNVILTAASGIDPESSSAMLDIEAKLRAMGYAAVVVPHAGVPSDHKMWINGTAWALICSDDFRSGTYSWCPYVQGAYDGGGYNSCGIPNSDGSSCPGW